MRLSSERLVVGAILALSLVTLALQAVVLRPRLWPAGAGTRAVRRDRVRARWPRRAPIAVIRPPDVRDASPAQPVTVPRVWPGGAARIAPAFATVIAPSESRSTPARSSGARIASSRCGVLARRQPEAPAAALTSHGGSVHGMQWIAHRLERRTRRRRVRPAGDLVDGSIRLGRVVAATSRSAVADDGVPRRRARAAALGARGTTATLMTLALHRHGDGQQRAAARSARTSIPVLGPLLLIFNWLITPLSFPIIGLAVLYFPHRARDPRSPSWIVPGGDRRVAADVRHRRRSARRSCSGPTRCCRR